MLSANGATLLYRQGSRWTTRDIHSAGTGRESQLALNGLQVRVDPIAEWQQVFREAWRIQRDYFYDPGLHGLDLKAVQAKYEPFVKGLGSANDLYYLLSEMLGELSVSHILIGRPSGGGGQVERTGLLGADYQLDQGRYRFQRIYRGEIWSPEVRAPLAEPGMNVKEGEYLIAVDGRELRGNDDPFDAFRGKAGQKVRLRIGADASGRGSRELAAIPIANEQPLRHLAWLEGNRRTVDELSGGRLAYVYLPNQGAAGYANFNRFYFGQIDKQGVVVDGRFNTGGVQPDYFIDYLSRSVIGYRATRHGADFPAPLAVIDGPKVLITNEYAWSNGDALALYFRKKGLGSVVGKTTTGAVTGSAPGWPMLIDGGYVQAPGVGSYSLTGEWEVENRGVKPDFEVELDPADWRAGHDRQLEKAVAVLLQEMQAKPRPKPRKPAYPRISPPRKP
jgi:tricorn protease